MARNELRNGGIAVEIEPQVFNLIACLASAPGRVLSRDEIIDAVWQGRIVSDSAVSTRINAARQALGDDGKSQRMIRTVSRRGFLFVPEIEVVESAAAPIGSHATGGRPDSDAGVGQERPSIVVLPFDNLSDDPGQSFFSDGIADDIITDLSRYGELFVIARQSAFAFHDRDGSGYDFARELGVAYLLEGSVRRAGGRVRVTAQLIDMATRNTLWAERFDRDVEDILDVQEEIATVIVNTLVGQVSLRHYKRVQMSGGDAISAYDHALKAQQHIWDFSRESAARARREAEAAIRLDPGFARAHAVLGWAHHIEGSNGWSEDPNRPFDKALVHAKAAIAADPNEPWGHCVLGFTLWWRDRDRDFRRGLEEAWLAVRLNPSNAHFRMIVGATFAYMGQGKEALREIDLAMRFNPFYPGLYLVHRSRALFVAGRFEEALSDSERAAVEMPGHANALALLAACYAALDRHGRAADAVAELRSASPDFTVGYARRTLPFADPEDLELLCRLLGDAGLPD
ncbi:MAG: winged helix-turn-helix domain-containing protein [Bauldia sp.]|uniref:winged helix-turn-helix domain-containing tetratricopeptide repeat protein n=1 Tax=Bauldia sp. TaxID=2575872 RepID=UPI001D5E9845|nr:winged helix-turn-helix domain-containing tetratricopeptide repeat protein [Bauldia sp.]MCB1496869.1 winged helix-turn-helix domain-containing protein [Bauldia sp.]